VAQPGSASDL